MCASSLILSLDSDPSLLGRRLTRVDVKRAFLQTASFIIQVYAISPRQYADQQNPLWLLNGASYVLLNASAKLQSQPDSLLN